MKQFKIIALVFPLVLSACVLSKKKAGDRLPASTENGRPPQLVLLAFDGSKSIQMWKDTREFARENNVKFTYFISGVYFLSPSEKKMYQGPGHSRGRSDIGFANSTQDIKERLEQMSLALSEGNELASHANGHFDGSKWSEDQWSNEFAQFDQFLIGVWPRVNLAEPEWWMEYFSFHRVGFRAPLLGHSPGMWGALNRFGFKYDTSQTSGPHYWPKKYKGIWNFPLASIHRVGTNKSTISMDYNFYYSQTKGKRGPEKHFDDYEEEMYLSYLKYFKNNYVGNRAPVHIGHHFSLWNGGAYWRAMRRFAKSVCHLPEVYCVTYRELYQFMEGTPASQLAQYQEGRFQKLSMEDAMMYMGPELQRVSFGPEKPLDRSEEKAFLKALKSGEFHLEE